MRKLALFLILLCMSCVLATAEPSASQLVGNWRYEDDKGTYEYTFMEDGTFHGNVARKGQLVWTFSGKWSLEGDTINYEFSKSSLERIPDGTTDRDKLIEITKDSCVIEARDGNRRKYERVK